MTISQGCPARSGGDPRLAELRGQPGVFRGGDLRQAGLGDVRQRPGRGLHVLLAQQVANADAKLLVVLEAVQHRVDVLGAAAQFGQRLPQRLPAGQLVQHEAVHQAVDHARVARQDAGEVRAVRAELDVEPQAGRIEAEQFPEHALAAERVAHLVEVHQRRVGIGRRGDRLQQPRGDGGQKMPASPRREEADFLLAQGHEVPMRLADVAERILVQHLGDPLRRRIGVEHEVRFGLGLGVVAEGVVQQVVEHLPIEVRLVAEIAPEDLFRRPPRAVGETHPQGQLPQVVVRRGESVGLQVEHDLQQVLDAAEEDVILLQQRPLLVRQAADALQLDDRLQGVRRCAAWASRRR